MVLVFHARLYDVVKVIREGEHSLKVGTLARVYYVDNWGVRVVIDGTAVAHLPHTCYTVVEPAPV